MNDLTSPPDGCTCTWSHTSTRGSIHIDDKDCPARPHERTWSLVDYSRPKEHDIDDSTPGHLQPLPDESERGFTHLPQLAGAYGGSTRVYESSAASAPHIWLGATCPKDLNDPEGEQVEAIVHLRAETAILLADQLLHLVVNHYQVDAPEARAFIEQFTSLRLESDDG